MLSKDAKTFSLLKRSLCVRKNRLTIAQKKADKTAR